MKASKKYIALIFLATYRSVTYWDGLKSQDRALSKQGATQARIDLRPTLEHNKNVVRTDFNALVAQNNFPFFVRADDDKSYYVDKEGDAIIFGETEDDCTYWYRWEWDNGSDELSILGDADELSIELEAFTEVLEEMLYLMALGDYQRKLAQTPEWQPYAQTDMDMTAHALNSYLRFIPPDIGIRKKALICLDYKGLSLVYDEMKLTWTIAKREKRGIR